MPLNKQKGNMYGWVTHTWNPIRGKCPHDCSYCYMKKFKVGKLRLEEKELKTNLGKRRLIFVGSSVDMFADEVPSDWIRKVLEYCGEFPNLYLFQSKNPERFSEFREMSFRGIRGTTIETDEYNGTFTKAPDPGLRASYLRLSKAYRKMVSIEPVIDFDLDNLLSLIKPIKPEFISIGADSGGNNLPEPSAEKVKALIQELKKFTEVKVKENLSRILKKK